MYKIITLLFATFIVNEAHANQVNLCINNTVIAIASNEQTIGLAGFTPHPTQYIKKKGYSLESIHSLRLQDFLDIEYVEDSIKNMLLLCKANEIDHLILAYLPIHFAAIKELIPNDYIICCSTFLETIAPQMAQLIGECARAVAYTGVISLSVPLDTAIEAITTTSELNQHNRAQFLVKELPQLIYNHKSILDTIFIINNAGSSSDDIVNYLEYEYLYAKKVAYKKIVMKKKKFHRYID